MPVPVTNGCRASDGGAVAFVALVLVITGMLVVTRTHGGGIAVSAMAAGTSDASSPGGGGGDGTPAVRTAVGMAVDAAAGAISILIL